MKRLGKWCARRLRDLFYNVGNQNLDLARLIAGLFAALAAFAILWNAIVMREAINLSDAFMGLATLATAVLGVAAKDWVRAKLKDGP